MAWWTRKSAEERIEEFVATVQDRVRATDHLMHSLRPPFSSTHPIPFFGRIDRAVALTVAMNPAYTEFASERNWPRELSARALSARLLGYFTTAPAPPHDWFARCERPLRPLGLRYDQNLTHLDMTPRATKWIKADDGLAFLKLVEEDAWVFFKAIELAAEARLVILTGTVGAKYYLDSWVAEKAPKFGWKLLADESAVGRPGFAFHRLRGGRRRELPVFFSSVSVNARPPDKYYANLATASPRIRKILNKGE